jgi:hypothetical protein
MGMGTLLFMAKTPPSNQKKSIKMKSTFGYRNSDDSEKQSLENEMSNETDKG